ncbi:MAG: hypothetical protein O7E51_10435 [Acidobacteria bacterium]|nr:hypothetical protein [Acidobacteriota bacterium]
MPERRSCRTSDEFVYNQGFNIAPPDGTLTVASKDAQDTVALGQR